MLEHPLEAAGDTWSVSAVNIGTAHAVIFTSAEIDEGAFRAASPLIENHPLFPQRTSVLWCSVESRQRIHMRIWERGVGETLSCGTGACAAVVIGRTLGLSDNCAEVVTRGGSMTATWDGSGPVKLAGPVHLVYSGVYGLS